MLKFHMAELSLLGHILGKKIILVCHTAVRNTTCKKCEVENKETRSTHKS